MFEIDPYTIPHMQYYNDYRYCSGLQVEYFGKISSYLNKIEWKRVLEHILV